MDNIRKVFRAKRGEIFSILMVISFIQGISQGHNNVISLVFYILFIVVYIGWLLVLGTGLKSMRQNPVMNYALFLVTGIVLITVVVSVTILARIGLFNTFEKGVIVVAIMLMFLITSLIILCSYIAKNLKINEKGDDIDINDYFGDIFLLILWPIGIWSIQPRINRLADKLASR